MPPDDPLGRSGPILDKFLKMPSLRKGEMCPYGKKCTYGNKCKYNHPERGLGPQKSVTERLVENAQKQMLARNFDSCPCKYVRYNELIFIICKLFSFKIFFIIRIVFLYLFLIFFFFFFTSSHFYYSKKIERKIA